MKTSKYIVFLLMLVTSLQANAQKNNGDESEVPLPKKLSFGGSISGQFVGNFIDGKSKSSKQIGIFETQVLLKSARTGKVLQKTQVDKLGHYRFSRLDAGKYQVCWKRKGFGEGCEKPMEVGNKALFMPASAINKKVFDIRSAEFQKLDRRLLDGILKRFSGGSTNCQDSDDNDRFLHKKRNDTDDDQSRSELIGEAYYQKIDPNGKRLTLGDWWELNGFDPITGRAPAENNGYKAAAIAYLNDNDLGFGRNMHCLKKSNTAISCWVANHGDGDQAPANADLAAGYINPGPTVTMEYSSFGSAVFRKKPNFDLIRNISDARLVPSSRGPVVKQLSKLQKFNQRQFETSGLIKALLGEPTVKFYVYVQDETVTDQAHAEFGRTTAANLDGCETRHVPGLCLNCHGGDVPTEIVNGTRDNWTVTDVREVGAASFREFDTETFKYPGGRLNTNNVENATFKRLNKLILRTNPSDAIVELVDNWYSSSEDTSIDENYVPASWDTSTSDANAYLTVVGKACRTCHVALGEGMNWDDKSKLDIFGGGLTSYLCGSDGNMPHAKVTAGNLNQSQRNTLLAVYGLPACVP